MLKIDSQAIYKELQTALLVECETLTDWLWNQVQSKAPQQFDRSMIHKEVIVIAGQVIGTISAAGIGASTTKWGSDSMADETIPVIHPQEPLHWMQEIVELSRPYVLERIVQMIQEFPFHQYMYREG